MNTRWPPRAGRHAEGHRTDHKDATVAAVLALHYSDSWADPRHQTTPTAWQGDDLPTLQARVEDYTRRIIGDFARQGTPVDVVQIGNEVTNGMLWPAGKIKRPSGEDWANFAALLKSCMEGARKGSPEDPPSVLIHYDHGGDNDGARYFFDKIIAAGAGSFDAIGLSYYPFWHGSLSDLKQNLDELAARYEKDLMIVETAYPWTLVEDDADLWVTDVGQLPEATRFPPTPEGQEKFFLALRRILQEVPDQRGVGFFAWEPGWLPGVGWNPGEP